MKHWIIVGIAVLVLAAGAWAQKPPLLGEKDVAAIAGEISGETAKRNLEGIARFHRQRGSKGFHEAAELVTERLRAYGLSDVAILQFPADGEIFYGTQRSRPAWMRREGVLVEQLKGPSPDYEKRAKEAVDKAPSRGKGGRTSCLFRYVCELQRRTGSPWRRTSESARCDGGIGGCGRGD
jgi:hypothetical protein